MFSTLRAPTTGTQRGFQAVYTALTDCWLQDPGISRGGCHSAAMRFCRVWLRGKPYLPHGKTRFYFAYLPVGCEKAKEWRSPDDIYRMSKVPELELAAIARVKSHLHHEPLLNKK